MVNKPDSTTNPFPNGYISTGVEDKLFKHVLFNTTKDVSKLRITSIGHDWTEVYQVNTGELTIPISEFDFTKDKFRIRSVLDTPVQGVLESDWVSQQVLGEIKKRKLNQFRVRGVSDKKIKIKSRWMYSELVDDDNELVVFQLLHDILDVMTNVHEKDFTALVDVSLVDLLVTIMSNGHSDNIGLTNLFDVDNENFRYELLESIKAEGMGSHQINMMKQAGVSETVINSLVNEYFEFQEQQKVKIREAADLVSKYFKENMMEQKKFSASEILDHARTYGLKDVRQEEVLDKMLEHIFLVVVEDAYEKAIEEANMVAFLHNDEEMQFLLTELYEFQAESSITDLFIDLAFVDNFVTFFADGLKLFLELEFNENATAKFKEDLVPTLLLVYKEMYIPTLILDSTLAELFSELDDDATDIYKDISSYFNNIKFEYYNEETGETWNMVEEYLTEIFEKLLMTDDHMEKHLDIDLISRLIGMINKDSLKMLITYDPVEAIQFIAKLEENILMNSSKLKDKTTEEYYLTLSDEMEAQDLKNKWPINDAKKLKNKEDTLLTATKSDKSSNENFGLYGEETYELDLSNLKKILENYSLLLSEGYTIEDILSSKVLFEEYNLKVLEEADSLPTIEDSNIAISHKIAIYHTILINSLTKLVNSEFDVPAYAAYHLELLYKHNITDLFTGPFVRHEREEEFETPIMSPHFYRYDDYFNIIWNIREDIHVHLGELDLTGERFPLGYFVLGTNTLEGETNSLQ